MDYPNGDHLEYNYDALSRVTSIWFEDWLPLAAYEYDELSRRTQASIGYYDSMNLYTYCRNNPINYIDPFGLCLAPTPTPASPTPPTSPLAPTPPTPTPTPVKPAHRPLSTPAKVVVGGGLTAVLGGLAILGGASTIELGGVGTPLFVGGVVAVRVGAVVAIGGMIWYVCDELHARNEPNEP